MKHTPLLTAFFAGAIFLSACSNGKKMEEVTIYSSAEDYRNEYFVKRLQEEFPNYNIMLEYIPSGNHAAKLKAEGLNTKCDITLDLDYAYLEMLKENFADLSSYDMNIFESDVISSSGRYLPELRNGGCIVVNTAVLTKKNLPEPISYEELLSPMYQKMITMPSPKTSGTGYMFLKSLVNSMGEEEAFQYFDQLSPNILQYTTSGSGPINSLLQGESAIGLGMTAQAVTEINKGAPFKLIFFKEGAPYSLCGYAMVKGKEERQAVRDVFDFFYTTLIPENNQKYFPEALYKEQRYAIENYPTDIHYSDMGKDGIEEKERLLEKWKY